MTRENEPVRQSASTLGTGFGTTADMSPPQVALLSNGTYSVMISGAGSGASAWRDLDVTRWREDATRDCWGQFVYVRCVEDGRVWSIGHQPLPRGVDDHGFAFHADRAEFRRRDGDIETSWTMKSYRRDRDAGSSRLVTLRRHGMARSATLT